MNAILDGERAGRTGPGRPPRLEIQGLSKTFPGSTALVGVDLAIGAGEVHALVGPNGSGKSTFIKILGGYHRPDPGGRAWVDGHEMPLGSAPAAAGAGIRFVHQDLGLIGSLSAVDNLAFGHRFETVRLGRISWRRQVARTRDLVGALGYDFDVRRPVRDLAPSERTAVAVARSLQDWEEATSVLVLDEPTAALPRPEVERLFALIRRVVAMDVSVIYVSHHLDEVFEIADTVTVLRDGRRAATRPIASVDHDELVRLMTGAVVDVGTRRDAAPEGRPTLSVRGLQGGGTLAHLDLDVRPGEVVGVAGITGSGREAVVGLLAGAIPRGGTMRVDGTEIPPGRPDLAVAHGVGTVPAERGSVGIFGTMTVGGNLTIAELRSFWRSGRLRRADERREAQRWIDLLGVVPPAQESSITSLSGGNQQKVVLGRWLRCSPSVLLLDEPTQGVDVAAKADIHRLVDDVAGQGAAVLVSGSDEHELVRLCHRVVVLRRGRAVAELAGDQVTRTRILRDVLGGATGEQRPAGARPTGART